MKLGVQVKIKCVMPIGNVNYNSCSKKEDYLLVQFFALNPINYDKRFFVEDKSYY